MVTHANMLDSFPMLPTKVVSSKTYPSFLPLRKVAGAGPSKSAVAIHPSKAQEFLAKLSRNKRNVWDRSRPDVQQWIMQFMYMGYDEQVSSVRGARVILHVVRITEGGIRGRTAQIDEVVQKSQRRLVN